MSTLATALSVLAAIGVALWVIGAVALVVAVWALCRVVRGLLLPEVKR